MKKKKFERLLHRNTLAVAVPAIIVFAVLMFMFLHYPIWERIRCTSIMSTENLDTRLDDIYHSNNANVTFEASNLEYTGFNYYVNGRIKGGYYYSINEDMMFFYIVKTTNPTMHIDKIMLKGKVIKDTRSSDFILKEYIENNNLPAGVMKDFYSSNVISEVDYPYSHIVLLYIAFASPVIICVLIILYTLIIWANPSFHMQARQLSNYGRTSDVIDELNSQINYYMIYNKRNIYITKDYLIVNYLVKTDVIKIERIKAMEKDIIEKSFIFFNRKKIVRLVIEMVDDNKYEIEFTSESLIDEIIEYIKKIYDVDKNA